MSYTRDSDLIIQNVLPAGFQYLGKVEHKTIGGTTVGKPKFYAKSPTFNNGKIFYTKELQQLVSLAWRSVFNKLKVIPNEYLKNGCGTEND